LQFLLLTLAARAAGSFCPDDHQLVFEEIFCTTLEVDSLDNQLLFLLSAVTRSLF